MELTYRDKVYKFLFDMKINEDVEIVKIVSPGNLHIFIQLVKEYINYEYDINYGYTIEFSNDYKRVRKRTFVVYEKKETNHSTR